jgi:hypothetical protein
MYEATENWDDDDRIDANLSSNVPVAVVVVVVVAVDRPKDGGAEDTD